MIIAGQTNAGLKYLHYILESKFISETLCYFYLLGAQFPAGFTDISTDFLELESHKDLSFALDGLLNGEYDGQPSRCCKFVFLFNILQTYLYSFIFLFIVCPELM